MIFIETTAAAVPLRHFNHHRQQKQQHPVCYCLCLFVYVCMCVCVVDGSPERHLYGSSTKLFISWMNGSREPGMLLRTIQFIILFLIRNANHPTHSSWSQSVLMSPNDITRSQLYGWTWAWLVGDGWVDLFPFELRFQNWLLSGQFIQMYSNELCPLLSPTSLSLSLWR